MRFRKLGSSDLEVSEVSPGSWLPFSGGVEFDQLATKVWGPMSDDPADISQIVWSPLAQGLLTGKYRPGQAPPPDSRATHSEMAPRRSRPSTAYVRSTRHLATRR